MAFKNLREFTGRAAITLPIGDQSYTFYDVDAETGLMCQEMLQIAEAAARGEEVEGAMLDDLEEADLYHRVLGDTYDELLTDGVWNDDLKRVLATVMTWVVGSVEQAEAVWEGREAPEAPARPQNRADRRAAARGTRKSAGTATATSTKTRARGSSTPTTRTATTKPPARASRGARSSSTSD